MNTIIIPPKNIIISEYMSQILPTKCDHIPTNETNSTSIKHKRNGEVTLRIPRPTTMMNEFNIQIDLCFRDY